MRKIVTTPTRGAHRKHPDQCAGCGASEDPDCISTRFTLPDALGVPRGAGAREVLGRDPILLVPGEAGWVRVLLRVRLTEGASLLLATWLEVGWDAAGALMASWDTPAYDGLVVDGALANAVPPWGMLGARARARVGDPDLLPHIAESVDPLLARVLADVWPYGKVAEAFGRAP